MKDPTGPRTPRQRHENLFVVDVGDVTDDELHELAEALYDQIRARLIELNPEQADGG